MWVKSRTFVGMEAPLGLASFFGTARVFVEAFPSPWEEGRYRGWQFRVLHWAYVESCLATSFLACLL